MALVVQDETADGEQNNFNKLVSRADMGESSEETAGRSARGRAKKKSARSSGTSMTGEAIAAPPTKIKFAQIREGTRLQRGKSSAPVYGKGGVISRLTRYLPEKYAVD